MLNSKICVQAGGFRSFNRLSGGKALVALVVSALLVAGCEMVTPTPKGNTDSLKITVSSCPYQITPLDTAELKFSDGTVKELTVSQDGTIETGTGVQKVAGLSALAFKVLLLKAEPQLASVEIKEFKDDRISVLGEVFHQIHTELGSGPMRLMDALAAANGFTPLADKRHVRVVRENAGVVETYEIDFRQLLRGENMRQNILIKAGDVITVPRDFL